MLVNKNPTDEVLVFASAGQLFSVPINQVFEVVCPPALQKIPHTADSCLGMGLVRNIFFPVIDFAKMFFKETEQNPYNVILLILTAKGHVGIFVDKVCGVETNPTLLSDKLTFAGMSAKYVSGFHHWNSQLCASVDLAQFLGENSLLDEIHEQVA